MSQSSENALDVRNVGISFAEHQVLQNLSCSCPSGALLGLIGPSGCGKSVLLKIIAGVLEAQSGTLDLHGLELHKVSLMFQEGALFDSLSVFDNVAFPLVDGRVPTQSLPIALRREVRDRVQEILCRVGLDRHAYKYPAQLSGGMRRRVSLARALVNRPALALLDDPTCGLDPVASSVIMNLIVEMHQEYRPTMLVVSHDLRRLLPIVSQVLCLFEGCICFQGRVAQLAEASQEVRRFVSCRFDLQSQEELHA